MSFEREGQPETKPHSAFAWLMSQRVVAKYALAVYAEWRIYDDERPTPRADQLMVDRLLKEKK